MAYSKVVVGERGRRGGVGESEEKGGGREETLSFLQES